MSIHVGQELTVVPPGEPTVTFAQQGDFLVGETFARTVRLMGIGARVMALLGQYVLYCLRARKLRTDAVTFQPFKQFSIWKHVR